MIPVTLLNVWMKEIFYYEIYYTKLGRIVILSLFFSEKTANFNKMFI